MWCERKQNFRTAQTKAVYIAALALCFVCLFLLVAERPWLGTAVFQNMPLHQEEYGASGHVAISRGMGIVDCIYKGLGRCMGVSLALFLCASAWRRWRVLQSKAARLCGGRICHCVMSLSLGGHAPPVMYALSLR